MKTTIRRRSASQRYTSAEFRPYTIALGRLALAWNDLQEHLADLFWTVMSVPQKGDMVNYAPLHVWHSLRADLAQREMLRAAIKHTSTDWGRPRFKEDCAWLVNKATELSYVRNDAIHAPLFLKDKSLWGMAVSTNEPVAPASWLFNPRAAGLEAGLTKRNTNLLGEFTYCHNMAIVLADFAEDITRALINRQSHGPRGRAYPTGRKLQRRNPDPERKNSFLHSELYLWVAHRGIFRCIQGHL
ncbi:MAG: hypothetical protein JO266_04760 [Acidobacteria bacterium]|nr:hypothetical protein [Acidobacteriota bacterium]